jgi:hypothetical protein
MLTACDVRSVASFMIIVPWFGKQRHKRDDTVNYTVVQVLPFRLGNRAETVKIIVL